MDKYRRNTVFEELKDHCMFAKDGDYIEVTEWKNGEGFDVDITSSTISERFNLTWSQYKVLKKAVKVLSKADFTNI